jgi:MFS family permease
MDNSGAVIGPFLGFLILVLTNNNYKILFVFVGIPAIFGVLNVIFFVKEAKSEDKKGLGKLRFKDFDKKYYI